MNIMERDDSKITVILTGDDNEALQGCVREVWGKVSDADIDHLIGVNRRYIYNIAVYSLQMGAYGTSKVPSPSKTLKVDRIDDHECHVTMGKGDVDIFIRCMTIALEVIPDWEFETLIGSYKDEVRVLLDDFRKLF